MRTFVLFAGLLASATALAAPPAEPQISDRERTELLTTLARELRAKYVFPDKATAGAAELERRWKGVDWSGLHGGHVLVARVNADLAEVFHDKHLNVRLAAESPPMAIGDHPSADDEAQSRLRLKRMHHGFVTVGVLPGNVGYMNVIAVPDFDDPATGRAIAQSFDFVADTDALIIDLRANGGGDPTTVAEVVSYLVDGKVHILDLYDRTTGKSTSSYTHDQVAGSRYGGKRPVFVLTSAETFSGGEELAYDLQTLGRAKLFGETTGGGANTTSLSPVGTAFVASIPTGRVESPRTHTNWEGTGVVPDVPTAWTGAFAAALRAAAVAIAAGETDPRRKDRLAEMAEHADRVPDPGPAPPRGPPPGATSRSRAP